MGMGCGKPCKCESYRAHLLSVGIAATAMPSRKGAVAVTEAKERTLHRDRDAYKRLRQDGLQPPQIDGCAQLEQRATTATEVESGHLNT